METQAKKIALVTQVNSKTSLANAKLLALEGFHVAITGPVQPDLERAVEQIGHSAVGILNTSANIAELLPIYKKVTCYFGGRINFLLLNLDIPLFKISDISEAFFTIQYALPYLDDAAIILLNSILLTKDRLSILTSHPKKKISVFLERDIL